MSSASGSFEDFMEQFKKRHAADYRINQTGHDRFVRTPQTTEPTTMEISTFVKTPKPMAQIIMNDQEKPVSVPKAVVLEDEWEPPEFAEIDEPEEWWNK